MRPGGFGERNSSWFIKKQRDLIAFHLIKARIKEDKLRRVIYPNFITKPHIIILEPSQQLEEEINAF